MIKDKGLAKNTALLTAASLVMRFVGMLWQLWLATRIGEAGIGLFQLVLSVSGLAATFAVSGIRFTSTRLASEELGVQRNSGVWNAMRCCFSYAAFFGVTAALILCLVAEPLGFLWLMDARTVAPLRILALGLPFMALSTVIYGYFTATGRVWKGVCVQVGREILTIIATMLLLRGYQRGNLEQACRSITAGSTIADVIGFLILLLVYTVDLKVHEIKRPKEKDREMGARMLTIALPLAVTSYARSGLSTLQHLLVPKGLRSSGLSAVDALAGYGVIQGMALPVVLFPSCLMVALAELIVPKLTEAQVSNKKTEIQLVTGDLLHKSLIFSIGTAFLLAALGDSLGLALYDSERAGTYIQLFSVIIPVMYMDMITDGCLKGLGEMLFCMIVNIADAGLSALMVWALLPRWGLSAYIFVICFTELFNFVLSLFRLHRVTGWKPNWKTFSEILSSGLIAAAAARSINIAISAGNGVPALILSFIFGGLIYLALLNMRRD